jgi:hypothetical protein
MTSAAANARSARCVAKAMRIAVLLAALAVAVAPPRPVAAQTAAPAACRPHEASVGEIGHVAVVSFQGPVFGGPICAVVASFPIDAVKATLTGAPPDGALVTAALADGGDVSVPIGGITVSGAGPYVVAPGGTIPALGADTSEVPRVLLAYSGQRVLIVGTSPAALLDLARALRTHPGLFGADAVERAVVLASGSGAAIAVTAADGAIESGPISAQRLLVLMKLG